MMFMALILLAVLFMFGFISSAAPHYYAVDVQRVKAWLLSFSTHKVKLIHSSQPPSPLQAATTSTNQLESKKKKDELKSVFETFDKNGDGYISKQELREAMKGAGVAMEEREIEEMVEKMDWNGDGLIDLGEFYESFQQEEVEKEDEDGALREAFEVFDGNKDGVISVEELGLVLGSLGLKQGLKVRDCEDMIRKVDVDGDGMIDFGEFKRMMRAGGTLFASSS